MMKQEKDIKLNNPFKVPDGYFDEVNKRIIANTSGKAVSKEPASLFHRFRPFYFAAASVAALSLVAFLSVKVISSISEKRQIAGELLNVSQDLLYADIDVYMLEESAADFSFKSELPEISQAEIVDYLLLENIDITDILENY